MAIALDAVASLGQVEFDATPSWNHTVGAGSDRALFVVLSMRDGDDTNRIASAVAWNTSESLTLKKRQKVDGKDLTVEIWCVVNPTAGTHAIDVTPGVALEHLTAASISLTGVDQTTPTEADGAADDVEAGATPETLSAAITTVTANDWLLDVWYAKAGVTYTPGAGQTELEQEDAFGDTSMMSYRGPVASPGATSMSWSVATGSTGQEYIGAAVAVKPSGGGGVNIKAISSYRRTMGYR